MEISPEDYLMFVDRALDGMMGIVEEMGPELANREPDFSGANSPYAILFHCIGVCNYWIGALIAGRQTERDRLAEFRATGTVTTLRAAVEDLKRQIRLDLEHVGETQAIAAMPNPGYTPLPGYTRWTTGAVLIHAYEELAQHHGQMELTRDLLMKGINQT